MSDQLDKDESEKLRQINAELKESLALCRFMLADGRAKLTANSNEADQDGQSGEGHSAQAAR